MPRTRAAATDNTVSEKTKKRPDIPNESPSTSDDKNDAESQDQEFIVEAVKDKEFNDEGKVQYLIKWKCYPSSANTWEPTKNLINSQDSIQEFEIDEAIKLGNKYSRYVPDQADLSDPHKQNFVKRRQHMCDKLMKESEYKVEDILGLTKIENDKYFYVSLEGTAKKGFVRSSLANRMFPSKVIDFYMKHVKLKKNKV